MNNNARYSVGDKVMVSRHGNEEKFVKATVVNIGLNEKKGVRGYDLRIEEKCPEWGPRGKSGISRLSLSSARNSLLENFKIRE